MNSTDISSLYHAFHDRVAGGKQQKLIICKICNLESISHSTHSDICEMCFDDDFWQRYREGKEEGSAIMHVIKVTKSGIIGNCYFPSDSYWAGEKEPGVMSLAVAKHYETKDKAENTLRGINCSIVKSAGKEFPQFTIKQIKLVEL